jgi:integrase
MTVGYEWAWTVVGCLLDGFDVDPVAAVVGLLALGYGQPVSILLRAQWSDFDLQAGVWWVDGLALPLTAPFVVLLKRYRRCCAGRNDRLFVGRSGGSLGKAEANSRVRKLLREFFNLGDLCAMASRVCPDLGAAEWRAQRLREYADLGATAEQVEALERELSRHRCSLLEAWHGDVLCVVAVMSARGFTR